jgi:hypothetical protein
MSKPGHYARSDLAAAALQAARLAGCCCDPEIAIVGAWPLFDAEVSHDPWCPLLLASRHDAN